MTSTPPASAGRVPAGALFTAAGACFVRSTTLTGKPAINDSQPSENQASLFGDTLAERIRDFELWVGTVRDLASLAAEGVQRILRENGKAIAEYDIAPLPNGSWAIHIHSEYRCGAYNGTGGPCSRLATRQECVDYFLNEARRHFSRPIRGRMACESQRTASSEMLHQLNEPGLSGFMESEPCNDA